jgi:alcohol dehydrogenase class IV
MGCCQYFTPSDGGADSFTVDMPRLTFGRGCLSELGARIKARGVRRAAVFTDGFVNGSQHMDRVRRSLVAAGVEHEIFDEVRIEPSDTSVMEATRFLADGDFDGLVSLGGGSVLDTAKAAMVYARYHVGGDARGHGMTTTWMHWPAPRFASTGPSPMHPGKLTAATPRRSSRTQ